MAIPFLHYFQRSKAAKVAAPAALAPALPAVEKPAGERLSKTVMPNATRTMMPQISPRNGDEPSAAIAPASAAPRTVSFAPVSMGSDSPPAHSLPPALALALEPRMDRVISLPLSDLTPHIPEGYLRAPDEVDGSQRVFLKAAEVEKGMSSGRPTVSLATIHQQVPQIFLREVTAADATQVALPFAKVLGEFANLQVRSDQMRPNSVPQVETPFLKVTLEDDVRFGTKTESFETGDFPPVQLHPPTAQSFANAEPEPAAPIPLPRAAAPIEKSGAAPARIPFKLSTNGTDAPTPECVPASAGPSVPSSFPAAPAPIRVPFKIVPATAPESPAEEPPLVKAEPWLTAASLGLAPTPPVVKSPGTSSGGVKIQLGLKAILQSLPPFQLTGDTGSVPDDVRLEFPFAVVAPQLVTGRVSVTPEVFAAAIPPGFSGLFDASNAADVLLPLQEILKNLPAASLPMRDDQVEQEVGVNFATPFSAKAEEDAKRFQVAGTVARPIAVAAELPELPTKENPPTADSPLRTPLQVALDTDDKLDAKTVVAHVNRMAGVKATAIMFADGLSLAGTLPAEFEADALCAMAPSLLQRVENHMTETKLGALRGMTLACSKAAVSFFMHDNLCLAALHSNGEISTEVRERLGRVVHELSRKYSHPV